MTDLRMPLDDRYRPESPPLFPQDRTCPYHPPTAYAPLREVRPLARVRLYDGRVVWAVTGHALARTLLADQRLSSDSTRRGFPAITERFAKVQRRTWLAGYDDPEHQALRRIVVPSFTVKHTVKLRPRIQQIVDERLDAMIAQGPPAELVHDFALPVPSMVICALLGVPYTDHEFFEEQSARMARPAFADYTDARSHLETYFSELIDRKQRQDTVGDGLLDDLVHRQVRAGTLDREGLVAMAITLLTAGHETLTNMISLGTFTLLQHPERLAELHADPRLLPRAIEELVRMLSIADLLRVAVEDIEVDGETIRAGDGVVFCSSVINRDEAAYPDPDMLDWRRSAPHFLGFGFGIHQCIGQNLARAEMEIAFQALFDRLPSLHLAVPAEEICSKPGNMLQGLITLPVTW